MADTHTFPDRRYKLFGREPDLQHLLECVKQPGLTIIHARPRMGKTWLLEELGRRLLENNEAIVGYHEERGADQPFLRCTADLYTRWIISAGFKEQAKAWLKRQNGSNVTRIGKIVGNLVKTFTKKIPLVGEVGEVVNNAFNRLALAQQDLISGGVQMSTIDHDKAQELICLMAEIEDGERPLVLILDAWEKTKLLKSEHGILKAFLDRLEDWSRCHIILSLRQPDPDFPEEADKAYRLASNLANLSFSCANNYPLPSMHLEKLEKQRLFNYLQEKVTLPNEITSEEIFEILDSYPGVLNQWIRTGQIKSLDELKQIAISAQANRYPEFDSLLPNLTDKEEKLAIRLALLPRLNDKTWSNVKDFVEDGLDSDLWIKLFEKQILESDSLPTFGHETRHEAARRWYYNKKHRKRPKVTKQAEFLIINIASRVAPHIDKDQKFIELLIDMGEGCESLPLNETTRIIYKTSLYILARPEHLTFEIFDEKIIEILSEHTFLVPLFILAMLKNAVATGLSGNYKKSIIEFTKIINFKNAHHYYIIHSLINRGELYRRIGETDKALSDLNKALSSQGISIDQSRRATINRGAVYIQTQQYKKAFEDSNKVIKRDNLRDEAYIGALINRIEANRRLGNYTNALKDCESVLDLNNVPILYNSLALCSRGMIFFSMGNIDLALRDFKEIINLENVPEKSKKLALLNRGEINRRLGNVESAIADFNRALSMSQTDIYEESMLLANRGASLFQMNRIDEAMNDLNHVIEMKHTTNESKIIALINRGEIHRMLGNLDQALRDHNACIKLIISKDPYIAIAYVNRGVTLLQSGRIFDALTDFNSALSLSNITNDAKQLALLNRGLAKSAAFDFEGSIEDFSELINIKSDNSEILIRGYAERAHVNFHLGNVTEGCEDIKQAIHLSNVNEIKTYLEILYQHKQTYCTS